MQIRTVLAITAALGGISFAQASFAATPVEACEALARGKFSAQFAQIPDAPTFVNSARVIPAGGDGSAVQDDLPEICRIEGNITPTVGFLVRMPTKNWNGKFMMGGCGGPCGNYLEDRIDPALVRNYAVVTTDMGHKGSGWSFGYNNLQGMIDFGLRSTHVTAVAAKEVVKAFYGKPAEKNYFWGCSTGGRQALTSAQRFPKDFDGIIGGSPPMTQTLHQVLVAGWSARANTTADKKSILSPSKLPMIHASVLAACDKLDGLEDGVLQHPPACKWEPKSIQCKGGPADNCLTPDEVVVVEKIYRGATWSDGKPMYLGNSGRAKGTELKWQRDLGVPNGSGDSMAKYFGIGTWGGPTANEFEGDIDQFVLRTNMQETFFYHLNPDLRNFKELGGKFIFFGGWDDGCCRADAMIDYYETVTRVMGGLQETQEFMRMFLPSGQDHCRYGIGGGELDYITAMENWAEKGQAPEQIIAHHMVKEPYPSVPRAMTDYGSPYVKMARHPLPADSFDRAHPVYPYPDWPKYSGKGDSNDPATWVRVKGKLINPGKP